MDTDRSLEAILFTDIVDSTANAARLGDSAWRGLLRRHHLLVRRELELYRGREVSTAGDGFLATFDKPADAIHCACAIRDGVRKLGLEIRSGIHMGAVEWEGGTLGGIAVHIGARVAAAAGPGDVLVSSTVRELEAGSGFAFEDRGGRSLKGVPGEWRLFAVTGCPAAPERVSRRRWRPRVTRGSGVLWGVMAFLLVYSLAGLYVGMRASNHGPGSDRFPNLPAAPGPATAERTPDHRISAPGAANGSAAALPNTGAGQTAAPAPEAGQPPESTPAAAEGIVQRESAATDRIAPADSTAAAPPAEGSMAPHSYASALQAVEAARREARAAGAGSLAAEAYRGAESVRAEAADAARAGRYAEAEPALRRAERGYRSALAAATARSRLEPFRDSVRVARAAADPSSDAFAKGRAMEQAADRADHAGKYQEALADLTQAVVAFRAAAPSQVSAAPAPTASAPAAPLPPAAAAPPAAPAPPPARAGSEEATVRPAEEPQKVVAGVLDEMRRAIESEDLDALRRTWIGLSAGDADSFHKWFERVREIHVRYDVLSAEPAGDRIVAKLQTRYEAFNESVNKREDQSFRQVLELEPRGGRWVVVASR